ncbi:MAG: hypothetical protein NZ949_07120, partial [Candidatus Kapabacteria bacterium]|nr:hypothetical protein [Candidatus Kapabacteria bacterium]MDW7996150.1 hypothetical protein [Bacteroidota bacterium]
DIAALSIRQAYLNPAIVVLEFVLSHDALHGGSIQFRGTEGWALISGGDSLRALPESRLTLSVHGYVTVWPGDANNDGNVDGRDVAVVGLYAHRKAIGYRRTPASTEWRPQKALAWVDPEATHADCDGNGVVSVRDVAVVLQNYGYNRDGFTRTAGLPPVELRSGDPLLWGRLPPDAEIVVGMITGCPGVRITGLRLAEPLEPLGIVVAEESLFVFVIVPQGSETLTILGQGPVCGALVEYRGGSGGWHQLEWQGLPVTEAPWGTDFQFRLRGEKMCLEGYRDLPGRVVVYSLLGQELAHFLVPPGEESWCTGLPLQGPAVCIATYWTPRGRSSSLLFVP